MASVAHFWVGRLEVRVDEETFEEEEEKMLYSHVTLLMLRVVDVVAKTTVQQSARMLVAEIHGEIQIGALFPIHRQIAGSESCGEIWEQYGIQRSEIAMLTVKQLNEELPFKLGLSIRDSCWTERIAMEQTIAFLREGVAQCSCCQTPGCNKKSVPVVAVIGPGKSSSTIAVQNLLQVFRIPQVGYSATTPDLSDKEQFGYFLRVVPSDVFQAQAINRLLHHYNWTYVAVLYSAGNYGEKGFESLERLIAHRSSSVCVAYSEKIKTLASDQEYRQVLARLDSQNSRPQVVVCFCEGASMRQFFKAQKHLSEGKMRMKRFQWIGSDGWADRNDVVEGLEEEAEGSFSIRIHAPKIPGFRQYYTALHPENNTMNPWFREFWQQKFNCQFAVSKEDKNNENIRICTGDENMDEQYKEDPKLSQVINSIRVVALGLKAMYQDRCRDNSTLCTEMLSRNGTLLYEYLLNVTYSDQFKQPVYFDRNGDPPAWYDILNYIGTKDLENPYNEVGSFKSINDYGVEELDMTASSMFFDKTEMLPESVCSRPCGVGQRQRETMACCWICESCLDMQYVNKTTNQCMNCSLGSWPNQDRTGCEYIIPEVVSWTSFGHILALILAVTGIITSLATLAVFLRHNSTPVVKSTTRELSYIILSGLVACYAVSFALLATPSPTSCFITRVIPPIAFAVVYSALLTKTNRIARILAGSKKRILTKKPRFLTTFSQVVITWILVAVQCVIVGVGLMRDWPDATYAKYALPRKLILECDTETKSFLIPFFWDFFLITLCTLYAFKTRNLPENFNEAKFIGFTMYCTVVVWIAFLVLHMGTIHKALVMSFSYSLSASVALALLFFPKLYIIVMHPEKNIRASYTTTKLIRCHFGNSQAAYDSTSKQQHLGSKTTARTSVQSGSASKSSSMGGGVTRTASVHVPVSRGSTHSTDVSTQTEATSKFARSFSIVGRKKQGLDDDVQQLVDACRRYQDEKINSTAANLLLEESEDEVGALLADSIENSMRTVLSTVAGKAVIPLVPMLPLPSPHTANNQKEEEDHNFEQRYKVLQIRFVHCKWSEFTALRTENSKK
uniref:G_PROTEIN_RECEP_F3_4 domain-containing protein n=1 Tax=Caenorhabditis japonica TaxID=281687 RepID=A0A8R1DJ07_CAEJA